MSTVDRRKIREDESLKVVRPAVTGMVLLVAAVILGTALMLFPIIREKIPPKPAEVVQETPKVTHIPARPSMAPTPVPDITSFKLFTYGRELDADGFTAYVGDKPVTLSVEIVPFMSHPPVNWEISDSESARLTISDDRKTNRSFALVGF